jgi:hypothetical protein
VRAAAALDPLSPSVNTELGHALVLAGRYEEAAQLRKAIGLVEVRSDNRNVVDALPVLSPVSIPAHGPCHIGL